LKLPLALLSGLIACIHASAAPLVGINVSSADLPRVGAWATWTGRSPDIIGDILFAQTWNQFAGDVPGVGVDYSLNLHVPPSGSTPNPFSGVQMELSIPLFPNQDSDGTYFSSIPDRLSRGANGDYDIYWRRLAEKLVARGLADAWIRPGWEMNIPDPLTQGWDNGGWLIGNSDVAKHQAYAAYWRRFHAAMMSVPGARFKWTFCMLAGIETMPSAQQVMDHAYPGDAYVDFISADFYDGSNYARYQRGNWQRLAESWQDQVSMPERDDRTWDELAHGWRRSTGKDGAFITEIPSLDLFRQFARDRNKPFMISEWGINQVDRALPSLDQPGDPIDGGNDNPEFIAKVAKWAEENDVFALIYFDFYLSRQNPFYGESRINYVDSALMDHYWDTAPQGNSIHPARQPSPRAAAAYLTAFHDAPNGGIPPAWVAEGRRANASAYEFAADGTSVREIGLPQGAGWSAPSGATFTSTAAGSLLDAAPLVRGGSSTFLVKSEVRSAGSGSWSGLRFLIPGTGSGGYSFEALCGSDGLPSRWRLRRNGTTIWLSEREPILSRLENKDWRTSPISMAVRVRPGPSASLRIEMFFGADTAGHHNDSSPLSVPSQPHIAVITDRAGTTASGLACFETLAEEDFEDGHAGNFTPGGWTEKRLHYRADPTPSEKQALAGQSGDRHYRVRARIGITTPGSGGLTVLSALNGDAYRVELTAIDRADAKDILQQIRLRRVGTNPAVLASWTPAGDYFLGAFHDLDIAADALPDGNLNLRVSFNGSKVIDVIEVGQASRSGRFGPWAAAGTDVSVDEWTTVSLASIDAGGESYETWAARHFGVVSDPLIIGATRDPDGDGVSNADERLTGTDPKSGSQFWRIAPGPGGSLSAPTLPGRRYRWQASPSMSSGTWQPVGEWIIGNGQRLAAPISIDGPRRFYRLLAEWE
jgi:hypothetical protein